MARASLTYLLALALPAWAHADGSVWLATGGESSVYLAGTIHKLSPDHYPLPAEYQAAYQHADVAVFETDIGAMASPVVRARLAELSRLPGGQTLTSILSTLVHRDLADYCRDTGFPIELIEPLKPAAAMLSLLSVALQSLGITAPGVDEYFYRKASRDAKDIRALETVDEQIAHLLSLGQGDPDRFVELSVQDLREARDGGLDEGLQAWRAGGQNALIEHFVRDQMLYTPELYQSLLVDRNRAWMPLIREYLATPEVEIVLVGVAHLVGEHGLVALLENEGFEVRPYRAP